MPAPSITSAGPRPPRTHPRRWDVSARARKALDGFEHLIGGLGTSALALVMLLLTIATALACLVGVGLVLMPLALRAVRAVANRERTRLSRWRPEIAVPPPAPAKLRAAVADPTVRRELRWLSAHATLGLTLGLLGMTLPFTALTDLTFPVWWHLVPPAEATPSIPLWQIRHWPGAFAVSLLGLAWIAVAMFLIPGMARFQAWPGRRLLVHDPDADLALRVAQLTATRAAALDAHATELRRIERSLHDGTQNRMVAVTVLLGAARRAVARERAARGEAPDTGTGTGTDSRGPSQGAAAQLSDAEAILEQAQGAAEQALAELRGVVRSILPPVLADRSLTDALGGLAAGCPVPCGVDTDVPDRCAASVEATAYFVVAEALTNVARHSGARQAAVTVRRHDDRLHLRITDDGRGGADVADGSGLTGIRRRSEALDGTLTLTSPPGGPTTLEVNLPCGL